MTQTIRQTVTLDATPHEIFEALLDSRKHAAFTGAGAKISRKIGGRFSVWDGYATGKTLQLKKDALIVQSWRTADFEESDPDSEVTFKISKKEKKAQISFVQKNVPDEQVEDLKQGWKDFYWEPLKKFLAQE